MIEQVSPQLRIDIVKAKTVAMKDGSEKAREFLQTIKMDVSEKHLDHIAVRLVESEIYYLDRKFDDAFNIYASYIEPLLEKLDPPIASVIADNRSTIQMASLKFPEKDDFYHLVDQRRILGVDIHDYMALVEAGNHVKDGKHYRALPIYWQQVQAAYQHQNWRAMAMAEAELSRECLSLGWWEDAAYHAMLCMQKEVIEEVGKSLLASKSVENIRNALVKVIQLSSLSGHAVQVMRLIEVTSDGIPDDLLGDVTKWLMKHAEPRADVPFSSSTFESLWSSIASIANRLDAKQAKKFTDYACQNDIFKGNNIYRRHVIEALIALCPKLSRDDLIELKDEALPLVGERKNDVDYVDAMNLLRSIAHHGGDNLRDSIRQQLVPPGIEIRDAILLHAANYLGWKPRNPEIFSDGARKCAAGISKQVQRLAPGEEPAKIGAVFTVAGELPQGQRIAVHRGGGIANIEGMVSYRKIIDEVALRKLLSAILAMISENDNLIGNRIDLVRVLSKFSDVIPGGLEHKIVNTLGPLAAGQITETEIGQTYGQSNNPLNPFKTGPRNPTELRGAALAALGVMEKYHPDIKTKLHDGLLIQALTSADPELRREGLIAAESCQTLSKIETATIAIAALDMDDKVAARALRLLHGINKQLVLDPITEQIILRAFESALASGGTVRRYYAAALLSVISMEKMESEAKKRIENIAMAIRQDVCYSVRSVLAINRTP